MMHNVVLKRPADFFRVDKNQVFLGRTSACEWTFPKHNGLVERVLDACFAHVTPETYSSQLRERFLGSVGLATAFVINRSDPADQLRVGLFRYTNEGEHCLSFVVDSRPHPSVPVIHPNPNDPTLYEPIHGQNLTHAWIIDQTDGYEFRHNEHILQLELSWSEPIHYHPRVA